MELIGYSQADNLRIIWYTLPYGEPIDPCAGAVRWVKLVPVLVGEIANPIGD